MQSEEPPTIGQIVFGSVILFVIATTLVLVGWPQAREMLWTQEAAAWVQAIGSIAAVAAGVAFVERQIFAARKLEADKRHLDDLMKTEVVRQLAGNAIHSIEAVKTAIAFEDHMEIGAAIDALRDCATALEALPSLEIPGSGLAVGLARTPRLMKDFGDAATRMYTEIVKVKRAVVPNTSVPSRVELAFNLRYNKAHEACRATILVAGMQVENLRRLAGVTD